MSRPPLPPFSLDTARQKVRAAEDRWNSRNPAQVALAYTSDSQWRNRHEFLTGRAAIEAFLADKWNRENDYRLIKELYQRSMIMTRIASINDLPISKSQRAFHWPAGARPPDHPGLTELGL